MTSRDKHSWEEAARILHGLIAREKDVALRMSKIADFLLGRPYLVNPLGGGANQPERWVVRLDAFDCVTFVETTLALARTRSNRAFVHELRNTRYRAGRVDWLFRLHFFSDWIASNQRRGAIVVRSRGTGSHLIQKNLDFLEGFPAHRVRFHVVPKRDIRGALPRVANGTIVAFASLRSNLDFFHVGLLFFSGSTRGTVADLRLYHASRSAGEVIAEPLADFLERNRMRGIAFASPKDPGGFR